MPVCRDEGVGAGDDLLQPLVPSVEHQEYEHEDDECGCCRHGECELSVEGRLLSGLLLPGLVGVILVLVAYRCRQPLPLPQVQRVAEPDEQVCIGRCPVEVSPFLVYLHQQLAGVILALQVCGACDDGPVAADGRVGLVC